MNGVGARIMKVILTDNYKISEKNEKNFSKKSPAGS